MAISSLLCALWLSSLACVGLGDQRGVLKHHLHHGGRVGGGGKTPGIGELKVKGKGGMWRAGSDVDQVVILLILEELPICFADPELRGGPQA